MDRNLLKPVVLHVGGGIMAGLVIARVVFLGGSFLLVYLSLLFAVLVAHGYTQARSEQQVKADAAAKRCCHRAGSSRSAERLSMCAASISIHG
jgi:hypothetical protein